MHKNIEKILYTILLLSFFKPDCIAGLGGKLNVVFSVLNSISIILILCINLKEILRTKRISKIIVSIFLFCLVCIVSTFFNSTNNLKSVIFDMLKLFSLSLLFDYGMRNSSKKILSSLYSIFSIYIIINLVTMIIFLHGMWISPVTHYWQNWFLGYDNNHIVIFLPTLIVKYLYDKNYKNKLSFSFYFILFLVNISVIYTWSATSVIAIILFDLFLIFNKFLSKLFNNFKKYVIYYLTIFMSIVVLKIQNVFSFIIVDILKKDLTFSGRLFIWEYIKKYIMKKPILGYGIQNSSIRYNITSFWQSYHAHNFILEILYRGGIVLLCSFIYIMFLVGKSLKESKSKYKSFIIYTIFIYSILLLTEFFEPITFMYLLIIFYNIDYMKEGEIL